MSTIKLGWGGRIAVLYGGFVILIVALVTGSMRQDFQLVSTDYYGDEIRYQEVIDAGKNQAALSAPVAIVADANTVNIELPQEFAGVAVTGEVHFYSPVNADWDKVIDMNTSSKMLIIPRTQLHTTRYKVKITWNANNKQYYQESEIALN